MSSSYRSLHINTSREIMEYKSYPMRHDYPTYPNHRQIAQYFDRFVDNFGFRDRIQFRTEVVSVVPAGDGEWDVSVRKRGAKRTSKRRYSAVIVANGHHWDARWPEPAFPGADTFTGEQTHSHHYKTFDALRGQARARARHRQLGLRHRGRDVEGVGADVHGDAARRARRAQVRVRHPDRPPHDVAGRPGAAGSRCSGPPSG